MAHFYPELVQARDVRRETSFEVSKLSQQQADFRPAKDKWSVGEVLDHLLKTDALIVREIEVAFNQRRRGLPFVYRGIADVDTSVPFVLKPVLPFFEIPFGFANALVPPVVRRFLTGNRRLSAQAPKILEPRFGRPLEELRRGLEATFETLRQQLDDHPQIDLNRVYYYNPVVGLSAVPGMYKFLSNHESRHQQQIREILDAASFPMAA